MPSVQEADWLASRIPNCRIKVLPDSGHVALLEKGICLTHLLQEAGFIELRNPRDSTWKQSAAVDEERCLAGVNDSPRRIGARGATDSTGQARSSDVAGSEVDETAEAGSQPSISVVESGKSGTVVGDRQTENGRAVWEGENESADFASALKRDQADKVSAKSEAEDELPGPTLGDNLADQLRTVTQRLSDGLSEEADDERAASDVRRGDSNAQRAGTDSGLQKERSRGVPKQGKAIPPSLKESAETERSMTSSRETEQSPPVKKKRTIPIEEMNRRRRSRKAKKDSGASSFLFKEDVRWLQGLGGGVFSNLRGFLGLTKPEAGPRITGGAPLTSEGFGGLANEGRAAERERAGVEVSEATGGIAADDATELGERAAVGVGSDVKAGTGVLSFLDKLSGKDGNNAGESLGGASAIGVERISDVGALDSFGFAIDVDRSGVANNTSGPESSGADIRRSSPVLSKAGNADSRGSLGSRSARSAGIETNLGAVVDETTPTSSIAERSRLDLGIIPEGEGSDVIEASSGARDDVIRAGNGAVASRAYSQGALQVEGVPETPTRNGSWASENRTGSSQNGSARSRADQTSSSSVGSVWSTQAKQTSSSESESVRSTGTEETGRIASETSDERLSGKAEERLRGKAGAKVTLRKPSEGGSQVGEDSSGAVKSPSEVGLPAVSVKKGPEELKMDGLAAGRAFDTMLSDMPQYRLWNWLTRPELYGEKFQVLEKHRYVWAPLFVRCGLRGETNFV
jgi:hypothetical protein